MYFNLPDAYMGGYMVVDIDDETGQMDFAMLGTYPPKNIVVDDPWEKEREQQQQHLLSQKHQEGEREEEQKCNQKY